MTTPPDGQVPAEQAAIEAASDAGFLDGFNAQVQPLHVSYWYERGELWKHYHEGLSRGRAARLRAGERTDG